MVGVDIGTASIKVCQVKETRKGLGLVRLGYAPLGPQVIVDGQVMDSGAVTETLQKVFHDAKIRQKECALSVSGQSVIIRKITVPMMTEAELDEQIQWEAEQHIPFDIKDVHVDYQVLRRRTFAVASGKSPAKSRRKAASLSRPSSPSKTIPALAGGVGYLLARAA